MSHPIHSTLSCAALTLLTAASGLAADKYVVTILPSKVMRLDGTTGAVLDPNFCDIDGLLGFAGAFKETREGIFAPNGELLVTDLSSVAVHRFSGDGSTWLGDIVLGAAPRWLAIANGNLWVSSGPDVVQFDLATYTPITSTSLTAPRDLHVYNGEMLVTEWSGLPVKRLDLATGNVIGDFASLPGFNLQMTTLASGNLLVAEWGPPGYHVLTPAGALVVTQPVGFGQPEGISELDGGDYLIATQQGLRRWDPVALTSTLLHSGPVLSIFDAPTPTGIGTNYCTANTNSTGTTGTLEATGSDVVAANDFHLVAGSLPTNAFGYFLTSRTQGFVTNPGGSAGNLCVAGAIGRFVQQIQNSGATGSFGIQADLNTFPDPATGNVVVVAGDTWYFQAWHRDLAGGVPVSNFTVGLEVMFR